MSPPLSLTIVLNEPRWPDPEGSGDRPLELKTGQRVEGTVQIEVLEDVEFEAFRIGFLWHTEGKGNRVSGGGRAVTLLEDGRWRAGEHIRLPLSLNAPAGPVSYQGKLLKVMWEMEARLARSLLRSDVVEAVPVRLTADPEALKVDLGPVPQVKSQLEAAKRGLGAIWVTFALVLLLGGVVYGAAHNWDLSQFEKLLLFLLLTGGFLFMLKGIWGRLGRGKLGEPTIQLSATELRLGEPVRFSLTMRPDQRTELRSLDVILECEERVVHGHGQYQAHRRKVVYERRVSLAEDVIVEPHRGFRKRGTLTVPDEGPVSFGAQDNQVVWWLRFQGDIVGWPDWKEPFLLTVRP